MQQLSKAWTAADVHSPALCSIPVSFCRIWTHRQSVWQFMWVFPRGGGSLKNLLHRTWDQTVSGCFRIDLGSKFHEHKRVSALWPFFTSQRLKVISTLHPPSLNNVRTNNSQRGDGRLLLFLKYVVPFPLQPEPTAGMSYFLLWWMDKEGRCRVNYFST